MQLNEILDKEQLREKFYWYIRSNFHSQHQAADHYGTSTSYISLVIRGVRPPNKRMLADMGYKKVVAFVKDGEK